MQRGQGAHVHCGLFYNPGRCSFAKHQIPRDYWKLFSLFFTHPASLTPPPPFPLSSLSRSLSFSSLSSLLFLSQQLPGTNTLVMMSLHLKNHSRKSPSRRLVRCRSRGSLDFTVKSQATLRKQNYSFSVGRVAYQLKAPTTKPDNPSFTPQTYGRKNQSQQVGLWPPHTACLPLSCSQTYNNNVNFLFKGSCFGIKKHVYFRLKKSEPCQKGLRCG